MNQSENSQQKILNDSHKNNVNRKSGDKNYEDDKRTEIEEDKYSGNN